MSLDADKLRAEGNSSYPTLGGIAVTVPGSLRSWEMVLGKFGTRGLDTLLAPAIDYAENGFPISPVIGYQWGMSVEKMTRLEDSARVWMPGGKAPAIGSMFSNREFAATLRTLASQGVGAFYEGAIAEKIVTAVQTDGGVLSLDDLAQYQAEWIEPISADYTNGRGETYTMHEIPPNGQGLTALIALNIANGMGLDAVEWGSADYWHLLIEATKLAFADAATYIADPKHAPVPIEGLLSMEYANKRRGLIGDSAEIRQPGKPNPHGDTVFLTTADADGNMVSWIQSLYMGFGSGVTAGDTGIQLQNRGANFSLEQGHFNEAAPGKRPYHTIIPGFITKGNEAYSSFGVMGGFMQPQGHLQVGLNMFEYGMNPQTALDAPRFCWQKDSEVSLEDTMPEAIRAELIARGHIRHNKSSSYFNYGGAQSIVRNPENGVLMGGTEPRKDGIVAAY